MKVDTRWRTVGFCRGEMSTMRIVGQRLLAAFKSPWIVALSVSGGVYGIWHIVDMGAAGHRYELQEDLSGKTYIITGATAGIGLKTAEALARKNARVIMACRDREKCIKARREIVLDTKNKQIYCRQCDLTDFDTIRTFVAKLSAGKFELDRIDGLINNAAVLETKPSLCTNGIEKMLATNHLGSFLLTGLLLDKLLAQKPNPVRIVFLSTDVIDRATIDLDDFNADSLMKANYSGYELYKRTKLAQTVFAKELARRLTGTNISVAIVDPGRTKSNLSSAELRNAGWFTRTVSGRIRHFFGERRPEKSVRPVIYALADPEVTNENGVFIGREREEWTPQHPALVDRQLIDRLWLISEKWTRFSDHLAGLQSDISSLSKTNTRSTIDNLPSDEGHKKRWWMGYLW